MMRLAPPSARFRLGPALASGLSMVHYAGFAMVPEVAEVRRRYEREHPDLLALGIHLLVMQNGRGEISVGDSHAYAHTHEPFDEQAINTRILDYMHNVVDLPGLAHRCRPGTASTPSSPTAVPNWCARRRRA